MISRRLKPDLAIVTDVTHDTQSPMYTKTKQGDLRCGNGPVLYYGPAAQNDFRDHIIKVADGNKIPFQCQIASRSTGTDSFAYSAEGVASSLISLPLKYMHTTVEMVGKDDVQNVIKPRYHTLLSLKGKEDYRYIK